MSYPIPTSLETCSVPALTVFKDGCWMVYQAEHSDDIIVSYGASGSESNLIGQQTGKSVGLYSTEDKILMADKASSSSEICVTSSVNGLDWTAANFIRQETTTVPALQEFKG
jgi:hypothetical protein